MLCDSMHVDSLARLTTVLRCFGWFRTPTVQTGNRGFSDGGTGSKTDQKVSCIPKTGAGHPACGDDGDCPEIDEMDRQGPVPAAA